HIDVWARIASHFPAVANLTTQLPVLREISKLVAGIPQQRRIPPFANQTFRAWFERREVDPLSFDIGQRPTTNDQCPFPHVLLWPDTFNNYFHPATAQAAVHVLEAAGFRVQQPRANLCCGRPLYDFGLLDRAKSLLRRILDVLASEIANGVPIVVLEP